MAKFGRNKFKQLNRIAKHQKTATSNNTNKVLKKKANAEKKVTFQKEVLLKEAANSPNSLVENITKNALLLEQLSKKPTQKKTVTKTETSKPKLKSVEKHKKRQKTQISDTKLLLSLMKTK